MLNKGNKRSKKVHNVGINDYGEKIKLNGKHIYEYSLWKDMLKRCYSEKYNNKYPTYKNCSVEEYFLSFNNFYNFIRLLDGFGCVDSSGNLFQLDKDLLIKGNKVYSRDTICFIPREVNIFITDNKSKRGNYPIGVYFNKNRNTFSTSISINGKYNHIGVFDNPTDAFNAYKKEKEAKAKYLAYKWKDQIDERAFQALMNYEVDIND